MKRQFQNSMGLCDLQHWGFLRMCSFLMSKQLEKTSLVLHLSLNWEHTERHELCSHFNWILFLFVLKTNDHLYYHYSSKCNFGIGRYQIFLCQDFNPLIDLWCNVMCWIPPLDSFCFQHYYWCYCHCTLLSLVMHWTIPSLSFSGIKSLL